MKVQGYDIWKAVIENTRQSNQPHPCFCYPDTSIQRDCESDGHYLCKQCGRYAESEGYFCVIYQNKQ